MDLSAPDLGLVLAEAKAHALAETVDDSDVLVLGCDQVLEDDTGRILHKAETMDAARRRLLDLSGKTHALHSCMVLVRAGETIWRHVERADLTMRPLTPEFVGHHLARVGPSILGSVGCYQIEGEGIQLFERILGDHFTIIGMPLLPLLKELRAAGVLET